MKEFLKKIYWVASAQFGFDPRQIVRAFIGVPRYMADYLSFRKGYDGKLNLYPCLSDWDEEGGTTKDEYFWQDLHVARQINQKKPTKHIDIGSRIDGFVAHVASFRDIEVYDIRPITTLIPGIIFRQGDLMNPTESLVDSCDSLSCLHALEHFGLGRYGDPIDPNGYAKGLENMAKLLQPGGIFYLSAPVGEERVEFNANRVFSPQTLVRLGAENGLSLKEFAWVGTSRTLIQSSNPVQDMDELEKQHYALGIFTFVKQ